MTMGGDYRIDPELQGVIPSLTEEEKEELEQSLLKDGYKGAPIVVWGNIIVDGHNRYQLCKKHNIPFEVMELEFESQEEVIQWMLRAQLGRRNLTHSQRIDLVRKFKPAIESEAKKRQGRRTDLGVRLPQGEQEKVERSPQSISDSFGRTSEKLADLAGVSEKTYRMADKVLESGNEALKKEMLAGKKSINAAHKELQRLEKEGRMISHPETSECERKKDAEKIDNSEEDIAGKIIQIQEAYRESCNKIQTGLEWLLTKQFYADDGIDLTSKLHSEISSYLEKIVELENAISKMKPDDCEDTSIIIIQK